MARTVMVIFGGVSTEYLVSLRSAYSIIGGLRTAGYNVIPVGITPDGAWFRHMGPDEAILEDRWQDHVAVEQPGPVRSPRDFVTALCGCLPDCIFPAVHGINCEDGALQGLLTLSGIPYVGCKVLSSAACMDKAHARKLFREARLPQCPHVTVSRRDIARRPQAVAARIAKICGYPCFLKPSNGGSSVGTCKVERESDLLTALAQVSQYDQTVLAEAFVDAREIEVSVIGRERPRTGWIGEIDTSNSAAYYDYQAKYFRDDGARILMPAPLEEPVRRKIRRLAIKAYKTMGCTGLARVDFFLDRQSGAFTSTKSTPCPDSHRSASSPRPLPRRGWRCPRWFPDCAAWPCRTSTSPGDWSTYERAREQASDRCLRLRPGGTDGAQGGHGQAAARGYDLLRRFRAGPVRQQVGGHRDQILAAKRPLFARTAG